MKKKKDISDLIEELLFEKNIPYDHDGLLQVLVSLRPIEEFVIRNRFGINCPQITFREIGAKFGVSGSRIRQHEDIAIRKLRHPSRQSKYRLIWR